MRQTVLVLAAAALLSACATSDTGWSSREDAQPFDTAKAACQQISYGIEVNYITCMAGRGWVKPKK